MLGRGGRKARKTEKRSPAEDFHILIENVTSSYEPPWTNPETTGTFLEMHILGASKREEIPMPCACKRLPVFSRDDDWFYRPFPRGFSSALRKRGHRQKIPPALPQPMARKTPPCFSDCFIFGTAARLAQSPFV